LHDCDSVEALQQRLFQVLTDPRPAADELLPSTGVSLEWERLLSPALVRSPDGRYGTRCSTLVLTERANDGELLTHDMERTYQGDPLQSHLRSVTQNGWPPRPLPNLPDPKHWHSRAAFRSSEILERQAQPLQLQPELRV